MQLRIHYVHLYQSPRQKYLDLKGEKPLIGSMPEIRAGSSTSPVYKWECGKYCNCIISSHYTPSSTTTLLKR